MLLPGSYVCSLSCNPSRRESITVAWLALFRADYASLAANNNRAYVCVVEEKMKSPVPERDATIDSVINTHLRGPRG